MHKDFHSYLTVTKHVKEKYIPCYLEWLSERCGFLNETDHKRLSTYRVNSFLPHLEKSREVWQVNQADYAIRLYPFFLSRI